MSDFDQASNVLPKLGTAAGAAIDGTAFTPAIDTSNFGSCTFIGNVANAIAYSAVSWAMTECDTSGGVFTAVAASDIVVPLPKVLTDTSKVFHAGYIGKKKFVKAAITATGGGTGQVTALLGTPNSGPVFQSAQFDQWNGP